MQTESMTPRLEDKVALITGGAKGIGRAVVIRCAREGANVAFTYNTSDKPAVEVEKEVKTLGRGVLVLKADISKKDDVKAVVDGAVARFGRVDVLVNNAGVHGSGGNQPVDEAEWDRVLGTNLKGTYMLSQAIAKVMRKQNGGAMVNVSSIGAVLPAGSDTYMISKLGVIGITRTMAVELAPYNIRVNAVCPGAVQTEMFDRNFGDERLRKNRLMAIPMQRVASPDEVARVVTFLGSEDASYVTGQSLLVDGGSSLALFQYIKRNAG